MQVTLSDEIGATGGKELSSKAQARRLAFYLFWNIKADFSRNYIVREDLEHFLPARKAAKAFALLDTDNDGKVCPNLVSWQLCGSCRGKSIVARVVRPGSAHGTITQGTLRKQCSARLRSLQYTRALNNVFWVSQVTLHNTRDAVIQVYKVSTQLASLSSSVTL